MDTLSTRNLHSHQCRHCGSIWRHDPDTIPEGKNVEAHTCPKGCGQTYLKHREQRWGEAVPAEFCINGERTIAVPEGDTLGNAPPGARGMYPLDRPILRSIEISADEAERLMPEWLR